MYASYHSDSHDAWVTQESLDLAIAWPITLLVHIVVHHGPWAHDTKLSESRPVDSNYKSYNITMETINTNINHMINHMGTPDIVFSYMAERPPSWAWARPITPTLWSLSEYNYVVRGVVYLFQLQLSVRIWQRRRTRWRWWHQ